MKTSRQALIALGLAALIATAMTTTMRLILRGRTNAGKQEQAGAPPINVSTPAAQSAVPTPSAAPLDVERGAKMLAEMDFEADPLRAINFRSDLERRVFVIAVANPSLQRGDVLGRVRAFREFIGIPDERVLRIVDAARAWDRMSYKARGQRPIEELAQEALASDRGFASFVSNFLRP